MVVDDINLIIVMFTSILINYPSNNKVSAYAFCIAAYLIVVAFSVNESVSTQRSNLATIHKKTDISRRMI